MNWKRLSAILLILFLPLFVLAQKDSLKVKRQLVYKPIVVSEHSTGKASLYSLFPGGGQFYNRRYWKIPLIYASLFVTGDFIAKYNKQYKSYKAEAINRYNYGDTIFYPDLSNEEIIANKDRYEYRRNLSIIIFFGIYLLQIVDATVDAHFFEFDVSPDVTFRAEPYIRQSEFNTTTPINAGITLSLKL